MLKPVDEAYLGNKNGNFLEIVEKIKPDIITVGADQNHDISKLQNMLNNKNLNAKVVRIEKYRNCELDSSCKIIKKIQKTDFTDKIMDNCD